MTQVFSKTSDHLRVLTVQDAAGNVETIKTTDEHPFFVEGLGWTDAGALERGMTLDRPDGSDAFVVSSTYEAHPEGIAVFNFEVEGDHTYFVADSDTSFTNPVWVHNVCVGDKFVATAYGKPLEFDNAVETSFFRRSDVDATLVRNRFNSSERKNWIKRTGANEDAVAQLRAAGLSNEEIDDMRNFGMLPNG